MSYVLGLKCKECGNPYMIEKWLKAGPVWQCPNPECKYKHDAPPPELWNTPPPPLPAKTAPDEASSARATTGAVTLDACVHVFPPSVLVKSPASAAA